MVLFFFGPNDYLISKKLADLKARYKEKWGDLNLTTLEGENLSFEQLRSQIQAMPLLATSRLVLVNDIFKNKDKTLPDKVKTLLDQVSTSTVLVFVERSMPDRRLSLFKALNKPKIAQEFDEITGSRLQDFILELARKNDSKIERNAAELLAEYTEGDLWRIENEVNKLANFTSGKITSEAVQEIVGRNLIGDIFVLIELIARGSKSKAIKQLENLLENGEPPLKILAMVNYQIRSLCLIKEASEQITNSFAISKKTGLSPFQVSKLIGVAKDFDWQALSQMYRLLANFDSAIKTGKIEAGEALKELVLDI